MCHALRFLKCYTVALGRCERWNRLDHFVGMAIAKSWEVQRSLRICDDYLVPGRVEPRRTNLPHFGGSILRHAKNETYSSSDWRCSTIFT